MFLTKQEVSVDPFFFLLPFSFSSLLPSFYSAPLGRDTSLFIGLRVRTGGGVQEAEGCKKRKDVRGERVYSSKRLKGIRGLIRWVIKWSDGTF